MAMMAMHGNSLTPWRLEEFHSGRFFRDIFKENPMGSMYGIFSSYLMLFTYMWLILHGKSKQIYHTWIIWVLV